jgi:hypothetical protein
LYSPDAPSSIPTPTFDDGPSSILTPTFDVIMDGMEEEREVRASLLNAETPWRRNDMSSAFGTLVFRTPPTTPAEIRTTSQRVVDVLPRAGHLTDSEVAERRKRAADYEVLTPHGQNPKRVKLDE